MTNSEQGAFSCAGNDGYQQGLTKREYFAGLAMQGMLADESGGQGGTYTAEKCITRAIEFADELLKQLESK